MSPWLRRAGDHGRADGGEPRARRHELRAWNRTRETAEAWAREHGGTVADSPRRGRRRRGAVITMVVDGPQVEQVLLGDDGAAAGAAPGTLFVDMSTIAPATRARSAPRWPSAACASSTRPSPAPRRRPRTAR